MHWLPLLGEVGVKGDPHELMDIEFQHPHYIPAASVDTDVVLVLVANS